MHYTVYTILYMHYYISMRIYGIVFTKNQKVWLCGYGRPDFSFLFKNCEIDKSQGKLVK